MLDLFAAVGREDSAVIWQLPMVSMCCGRETPRSRGRRFRLEFCRRK